MKKEVGGIAGGIIGGMASIGIVTGAGTSAAGITAGLGIIGGTMLGGLFMVATVPVVGAGLGYGLVKLITKDK